MSGESYEDEVFKKGWYGKPHGAIEMVKESFFSKSAYLLLDLLFHFENRYTKKPNSRFYCTNKELCATKLISEKSLLKARSELKKMGLIDFKSGHSHHATEYVILIDGLYYYRGANLVE